MPNAKENHVLTYSCENRGREIESPGKLPLNAGLVGHALDDYSRPDPVVLLRDIVLGHEQILDVLEGLFLSVLVVRFEGVEDSSSHQQIGKRAHDQ